METLKIKVSKYWQKFENIDNRFIDRLSKKYNVVLSEDPDFYFFTHSYYDNNIKDYLDYNCHRIFFGYENHRADWNICDYVLDSDYYKNEPRHKRFPLWARFDLSKLLNPKDLNEFQSKKKFCCMVVSNPDSKERIDFFHKLSEYKKVDSGGRYLNNIGLPVENKRDFLKDYKFVISFENSSYPGYTTEKLVEPMLVNSIPIYWGDPDVAKDFNTESFININDFETHEEAIDYIIDLDKNEDKYLAMVSKPWVTNKNNPDRYSEESLFSFFDFILKDSKTRKPVAKSLYLKFKWKEFLFKTKLLIDLRKLNLFK